MTELKTKEIDKTTLSSEEIEFVNFFGEVNCSFMYFINDINRLAKVVCDNLGIHESVRPSWIETLKEFGVDETRDVPILCAFTFDGEDFEIIAQKFVLLLENGVEYLPLPLKAFKTTKAKKKCKKDII